jgi:ATP-dependent exoDNAse (exonuclease V) beta subunit
MTVHKSKGLQFPVVIIPFAYGDRPKPKVDWVDDEVLLPEDLLAARLKLNKELKETILAGYVTEEEDRVTLDAINLLYVATTRPEAAL